LRHRPPTTTCSDAPATLIGRQLGAYRILGLLGSGGMGDVYRARDTSLGRDVAIKVLSRGFALDRDRLRRFDREARLLAALNHPHIAAIYGLLDADGIRGLVLELVEGQTLAARVAAGPLPIVDALAVSRQIADALEAAHIKGIVHRDLKPDNVKITPDGMVKVLDFGLAKLSEPPLAGGELPTPLISISGTRDGLLIGTAPYMSPEQARGKPADTRADVWAFGCVLYEMLTGRRAFEGETVPDTIARVLEREPAWDALPQATPQRLRDLIRWCLKKDATERLGGVAAAREAIEACLHARPYRKPAIR
jgi:eukaryotic-like serine/threonine-protein kinase